MAYSNKESLEEVITQFNGKCFHHQSLLYEYIKENKCNDAFICAYMSLNKYKTDYNIIFVAFKSIDHFENIFFSTPIYIRTFAHLLTSPSRTLYLDVDFITNDIDLLKISADVGMEILGIIKYIFSIEKGLKYQQIQNDKINWVLYDCSRYKSNELIKLSFHIFNNNMLYKNLEDLICDVNFITQFVGSYNFKDDCVAKDYAIKILKISTSLDKSVYSCKHYQLLRMPHCIKPNDIASMKRLIFPKKLTFKEELQINKCNTEKFVNKVVIKSDINVDPDDKILLNPNTSKNDKLMFNKEIMLEKCCCKNSNNKLIMYSFSSKINNLKWKEKRCVKCGLLNIIYSNSMIKNPRQYCNLPLNDIKEIEKIYFAINKFKITTEDNYCFIFKDKEFQKDLLKKQLKYKITFTKNVIALCTHNPNTFYVKSSDNKYLKKDGYFAYYCNKCKKYFNSNCFGI